MIIPTQNDNDSLFNLAYINIHSIINTKIKVYKKIKTKYLKKEYVTDNKFHTIKAAVYAWCGCLIVIYGEDVDSAKIAPRSCWLHYKKKEFIVEWLNEEDPKDPKINLKLNSRQRGTVSILEAMKQMAEDPQTELGKMFQSIKSRKILTGKH